MDALVADDPGQVCDERVDIAIGQDRADLVLVRQRVRDLLAGYPESVVADAVQVADELASNAYAHGQAPQSVRLILTAAGTRLRVEADDASVFALPQVGGRPGRKRLGMVLVDRMAASWGVQRHPRQKTVWAELPLTAAVA